MNGGHPAGRPPFLFPGFVFLLGYPRPFRFKCPFDCIAAQPRPANSEVFHVKHFH